LFDIIFVLPYVFSDHPSFPESILKRVLEAEGFSVGVIERPFWQDKDSFAKLGKPKLFFAVIAGPLDSVVLNYTSLHKRRKEDLYQANGNAFFEGYPPSIKYKIRPDRTVTVFSNRIRECFKDVPIIIGGLEASLRRFSHYDFQQERIRRSVLLDAKADLLVHGMGEKQIVNIARLVRAGTTLPEINLAGTTRIGKQPFDSASRDILPSHEEIMQDSRKLLEAQLILEKAMSRGTGLIQATGDQYVIDEPTETYASADLNTIYGLAYERRPLQAKVYSPALQMNLFSITSHRGCGGRCSFCSIQCHEGRKIISRSPDSILAEIERLKKHPQWKGFIADIGGASAEMYAQGCDKESCVRSSCLYPDICDSFAAGQAYLELLRACRRVPGVKKIFVGSGLRYDLLLKNPDLLEEIMRRHCGRFLRIAPEHTEDRVLQEMQKPSFEVLKEFVALFQSINKTLPRKIALAPYWLVGHPGETREDIRRMKTKIRALGLATQDTQIFTPTPGTLATAMYYAGCSSAFQPIEIVKDIKELAERKNQIVKPG
jgi:uncharacterized radical SAM protein YgiQ